MAGLKYARIRIRPQLVLHGMPESAHSREPKLERILSNKGYDVFLPTYVNVRRWSDRVKKVNEALFRAIFLPVGRQSSLADSDDSGRRVDRGCAGVPQSIAEEEIGAIRQLSMPERRRSLGPISAPAIACALNSVL